MKTLKSYRQQGEKLAEKQRKLQEEVAQEDKKDAKKNRKNQCRQEPENILNRRSTSNI